MQFKTSPVTEVSLKSKEIKDVRAGIKSKTPYDRDIKPEKFKRSTGIGFLLSILRVSFDNLGSF